MKRLARLEACLGWVLGDVMTECPQFCFVADDGVVAVFLPEIATAVQKQVQLTSRMPLPALHHPKNGNG